MKHVSYICDRCGKEQCTTPMPEFKCEFGRPLGHIHPLPILSTGQLCPICEAEWCCRFFNTVVEFAKGA